MCNNLLEHIGFFTRQSLRVEEERNVFVLIKRLDSNFQKKLRKERIITYLEFEYIHIINDLKQFAEAFIKRKRAGRGKIFWDSDDGRAEYKIGSKLQGGDLLSQMKQVKRQLNKVDKEVKQAEKELKELRKKNVKTFVEAVAASNMLSVREIQKHGELQNRVGKWLITKGYAVGFEVALPNGRSCDVIGFNEAKEIIIVEVKVSNADFQGDKKWKDYLSYCDQFYFCSDIWFKLAIGKRDEKKGAGFLYYNDRAIVRELEDCLEHTAMGRDKIVHKIAFSAANKVVNGY